MIHRRLVVRSGDRLSVYWDIFREYLLTGNIPIIPLSYLPSNDFYSVYKVTRHLEHETPKSVEELVVLSGLSEGTVMNIGSDLNMFGIANRDSGLYLLSEDLTEGDETDHLRAIRKKFERHAFTLALKGSLFYPARSTMDSSSK